MARWKLLLIGVALLLCGCDSQIDYRELSLPRKNPTSFEFNATPSRIKEVTLRLQATRIAQHIETAEDSIILDGKEIFQDHENINDLVLDPPLLGSVIFRSQERPVYYLYKFHIHLVENSPGKTRVEVRTINPRISIGVRFPYNILPISESNAGLWKQVEPSTIEEYRLLLAIGEGLGIRDSMPQIIMPVEPPVVGAR